jgi:ABC-type iron transport system FetAB ATPase subunit
MSLEGSIYLLKDKKRKSLWITHKAAKAVEKKRRTIGRYKDRRVDGKHQGGKRS